MIAVLKKKTTCQLMKEASQHRSVIWYKVQAAQYLKEQLEFDYL